ncbi:MAG TPA: toll/interleukin-1 receptor domain-containing protein [Thermoanaerobaculia bacterium]|jgi:hypothetical protein
MSTHVFFASYDRDDNDEEEAHLANAIRRIEKRVSSLLGADAAAEIAFFDTNSIKTGQQWEEKLAEGLRGTKVLVCMCSPRYVNSRFCAKEFAVFQKRIQEAQSHSMAIVPIVWERGNFPSAILEYQLNDARLPPAYGVTLSLSQFSRLKSQKDNLSDIIEVLAEIIKDAVVSSDLPPYPHPIRFDELSPFVQNPRSDPYYNVTLTVLHDDGAQWRMGTVATSIGSIADAVAKGKQCALEVVEGNLLTLPPKLDAARDKRHISIVVTDYESAQKSPWRELLADIDAAARTNCAVLVGWNRPELPPHANLKELLPNSSTARSLHAYFALGNEKSCVDAMTRAVGGLQSTLMQEDRDRVSTVESQVLRDAAEQQGISVDAKPTVSSSDGAGS